MDTDQKSFLSFECLKQNFIRRGYKFRSEEQISQILEEVGIFDDPLPEGLKPYTKAKP